MIHSVDPGLLLVLDYVYLSDTKLEMLYAQIPVRLRDRIAADLKIDLKVISVTVKERESVESRFSKARIVVEQLQRDFDVGTVDNPRPYFEGSLQLRWGVYPDSRIGEPLVYFGGVTQQTILGLGGSARHLIGAVPMPPGSTFSLGGSALPSILTVISRADQTTETADDDDKGDRAALGEVQAFTNGMTGPRQSLHFLAQRLLTGRATDQRYQSVLLGSPLFVARSTL
jgi:hypothetical protein